MRAALLVCALSEGATAAAQTAEVPQAPPNITIAAPPSPGPVPLPKGWTFRFDAPATCTACGDPLGPIVNGNAPWRVSGALHWQSDAGALGVRLTGQRGARLPLFMTPSMPGVPMPAAAADTLLSETRTQWQVTLSGERTLRRSRGGASLSLVGDLHLPLGTTGRRADTSDVPALSQTAFLAGFRVRW